MKESMETRVEGLITMLKGVTDKSVAVGFGVSRPDQVRRLERRAVLLGWWLSCRLFILSR